jgi:hypothetical protein
VSSFDRQQPVNDKSAASAARPVPAAVLHPARVAAPLGRGVAPSRVPLIDAVAEPAHLDVLSSDEDDGTGGQAVDEISH